MIHFSRGVPKVYHLTDYEIRGSLGRSITRIARLRRVPAGASAREKEKNQHLKTRGCIASHSHLKTTIISTAVQRIRSVRTQLQPARLGTDAPPFQTHTATPEVTSELVITNMPSDLLQRFISVTSMASIETTLPAEITLQIARLVTGERIRRTARVLPSPPVPLDLSKSPYYTPPATCLLLSKLSAELRRQILAYCLPARNVVYHPVCEDDESHWATNSSRWDDQYGKEFEGGKKRKTPRGPVTDLMVLNKQLCADISRVLYEERFFVIHVHEGLTDGGVEFLQAGRQPLQMASSVYDQRFTKFTKNSEFGFDRLKKIRIQIHPAQDIECRHTAINTYFINLALCRLLQRSKDERIVSIVIEFVRSKSKSTKIDDGQQVGRRAIQRVEQYWWDPDAAKPRVTSVHNAPDIELVLYPFANLTACHNVEIILPPKLAEHERTKAFADKLCASMKSNHPTMFMDDDLEMNIDKARSAMEEYTQFVLTGKKPPAMERMTEAEVAAERIGKYRGGRRGFRKQVVEEDLIERKPIKQVIESDDSGVADLLDFERDGQMPRSRFGGLGEGEQVFVASTMEDAGSHQDLMDSDEFESSDIDDEDDDNDFDAGDDEDEDEVWFGRDQDNSQETSTVAKGGQVMQRNISQDSIAATQAVDATADVDGSEEVQQTETPSFSSDRSGVDDGILW